MTTSARALALLALLSLACCWSAAGAEDKKKPAEGGKTLAKNDSADKGSTDKGGAAKDAKAADGAKTEPPKDAKPEEKKEDRKGSMADGSASLSDERTIAFINAEIEKVWKENNIKPSAPASEHELLRRMHLDLIGRVPTVDEIAAHMKRGPSPQLRRDRTLKALLDDEDFAIHWANVWTVWLLTRTNQPGIDRENFHAWVADAFATGKRYDEFVTDLLTATGKCDSRDSKSKNAPAACFILSHVGEAVPRDPQNRDFGQFEMVPVTSRVTRLFLSQQTQCVQCHDHPSLDNRKQQQFWGLNVFFRQVERQPPVIQVQRREDALRKYELVENPRRNPDGAVFFERRNGVLLKSGGMYLDGTRVPLTSQTKRRAELARLLIADPDFARSIVNRMWAHFMGRGFTNPVDDFNENNPVSHPELLDRLAKDFIASGYDLRRLMTWIILAKPYQLTSVANDTNKKADTDLYFSRMQLKAMSPEQLVESIMKATSAESTRATGAERRKMYDDWLNEFTVNFGDDEGNEATFNGTVVQALMLMNGGRLNDAVRQKPGSTIAKVMALPPDRRLNHLFLATLSRPPTAAERDYFMKRIMVTKEDPTGGWSDVMWALLNSNEFILNH